MVNGTRSGGALVMRLIVGLALLGWPRGGAAQGTWSVISLPKKPDEVAAPLAFAVDEAGNLYVADYDSNGNARIQKRDAQGNWSVIAIPGSGITALAVDAAGNLYVAQRYDHGWYGNQIQKRDTQGNWSVLAAAGTAVGQVLYLTALAVDVAGNLYVADGYYDDDKRSHYRIQKRYAQGTWSVIAASVPAAGGIFDLGGLAVDTAGNLYVADGQYNSATYTGYSSRIQKRDAQGNWSVLATQGSALGEVDSPSALALDVAGNLYVADRDYDSATDTSGSRIQRRDAQGNWSVIATDGASALAADAAGNLYALLADGEVQKRDAQGNWLPIAATQYGWYPTALAVDAAGNLHAAVGGILWKREAQGNWTLLAPGGIGSGQVSLPTDLAVDTTGNLYVADSRNRRVQRRDAQGNWSVIATWLASALAVDTAGHLYVADYRDGEYRIQKRDAQGNWSVLAPAPAAALAVDAAGNLYVASGGVWKGDAQGNWSVIATAGTAVGQVADPIGLAVDAAGNLYVADTGNDRVQVYTPGP